MPVTRSYGGYSSYGSFPTASLYSTTYRSTYARASTPATAEAEARSVAAAAALNAPATYKYLSRSDYYNAAPTTSASAASASAMHALRTIDTDDLDVDVARRPAGVATPGAISRDTSSANIAGAKPVVRIVTGRARQNSMQELTLGQRLAMKHFLPDPKKKSPSPPPFNYRRLSMLPAAIKEEEKPAEDEDADSDWTWETCSSSEEGPDVKYFPGEKKTPTPEPSRKASASTIAESPPKELGRPVTSRQSLDRWTRALFTEEKKAKYIEAKKPIRVTSGATPTSVHLVTTTATSLSTVTTTTTASCPPVSVNGEIPKLNGDVSKSSKIPEPLLPPISPARDADVKQAPPSISTTSSSTGTPAPMRTTSSTSVTATPTTTTSAISSIPISTATLAVDALSVETASSKTSSASPSPTFVRAYAGPIMSPSASHPDSDSDSDSDSPRLNRGWRRGQPPRSDVVVKLVSTESKRPSSADAKPKAVSPRRASLDVAVAETQKPSSAPRPSLPHIIPPPAASASLPRKTQTRAPEVRPVRDLDVQVSDVPRRQDLSLPTTAEMAATPVEHVITAVLQIGLQKKDSSVPVRAQQAPEQPSQGQQDTQVIQVAGDIDAVVASVVAIEKAIEESSSAQVCDKLLSDVISALPVSEALIVAEVPKPTPVDIVPVASEADDKTAASLVPLEVKKAVQPMGKAEVKEKAKAKKKAKKHHQEQPLIKKAIEKVAKQSKAVPAPVSAPVPVPAPSPTPSQSQPPASPSSTLTPPPTPSDTRASPGRSPGPTDDTATDSFIACHLDRLPSPFRKFFEIKSRVAAGETYVPEPPKGERPKYWDNTPAPVAAGSNPAMQLSAMRAEARQHQAAVKKEQEAILATQTEAPAEPWYDDESEECRQQLQRYEHRASDHHRPEEDKRTPEENMAIIKLYGGEQFPGGQLQTTPNRVLKVDETSKNENACGTNCHKKCERNMPNLCGIDQRQLAEMLDAVKREKQHAASKTQAGRSPTPEHHNVAVEVLEEDANEDDEAGLGVASVAAAESPRRGNEPPVKTRPRFRKYGIDDFAFLKVLGKGSFGKVILAELRCSDASSSSHEYYAIKCLKKDVVLADDDIECTMIERKVLALGCKHPFLCHLFCTFQTNSHLFFVMEYLNGGDLMFHIQQSGRFEVDRARFYSAEILLALKFLHRKGIVYRDLKLDNLLLDYEGHIRIADFGMCKLQIYLDRTTDTFCGTPDYMAPEIIKGLKYTYCVDWWSFGVLLYEMLIGQSPFNGVDEDELFWSICNESPYFPRFLSKESKQILQLLLEKDPSRRLGVNGCASGDVRDHAFFKCIDFDKLEKKTVTPPYRPKLRHPLDVSYFDVAFTEEMAKLTPVDEDFLASVNQQQFKGFSYTNPNYTVK